MQGNIKKNTVYNMIKTLASIIFPLITFPYISRILHPENVGKINFSNSIISYFSLAATLGVTTYAVRECSRVREQKEELSRTASEIMSINVCTMSASYLLLAISLIAVPKFHDYRLLMVIQSGTIMFTVIGTDWMNTAMEDFKYITLRSVSFQFLSLILMFMFVRNESDYIKYACISLLSSCGAQIMNIFYRRRYCTVRFTRHMNWRKHFPPILLLFAMLVSQTILHSMDTTMIGFMKGDYEVGLYTTAMKVVNIVTQVIASITWVLMPQLTLAFSKKDYGKINGLLKKSVLFSATLTLPCLAGLVVLSKEVVEIIGGAEYLEAAPCLRILSFAMIFNIAGNVFGNMILLPDKREKQFTVACVAGMAANVVMNASLIPAFGINGAAFATVVSAAVVLVGTLVKKDPNIKFKGIWKDMMSPVVGTAGIVVIGFIFNSFDLGLWIKTAAVIGLSVVWYGAVMVVMKNMLVMGFLEAAKKRMGIGRHGRSGERGGMDL